MPSTCPKCRRVLEHDEVCCAQVSYAWRCTQCGKLSRGFAFPYGKCFLCGGELEDVTDRSLGNAMDYRAIREALQFELNAYHFYRMALARTQDSEQRVILDFMAQNELDHLHELEEKYRAHLDPAVLTLSPTVEELLANSMFAGIDFHESTGLMGLYKKAIEMEQRTREYFLEAAARETGGMEKALYLELAAEEAEHVALLETEMSHLDYEIHPDHIHALRSHTRPL